MRWPDNRHLNAVERVARRTFHRYWHRWFAWYPVSFDDQWVWLETVDRRLHAEHWAVNESWKYRDVTAT